MLGSLKRFLLKAIDITALGFLEPFVRLAYGEEPKVQLKKIGQFTIIPILAMLAFLLVWAFVVSPNIKTKSGELPSPSVVWDSALALDEFAKWENAKERAYLMTGEERQAKLAEIEKELEKTQKELEEANQGVIDARELEAKDKEALIAPIAAKIDEMDAALEAAEDENKEEMKARGAKLPMGDNEQRRAFLAELSEFDAWVDAEEEKIDLVKDQKKAIEDHKDPRVVKALALQTMVADREQNLRKVAELLGDDGRELKLKKATGRLEEAQAKFFDADEDDAYKAALSVIKRENKVEKTAESEEKAAKTLYYQIRRSILCVFVGFLLGSAIAIPIGVLCGLSKTFMAAMTPFIALFKPVSPIVWLPIALIVCSALIPDPDKHWFTKDFLWELWWLGKYEINPAFLASAVTVALCSLWATMVNTALGVASVDKDHINVARVLRLSFTARLFKIVLPSALPLVFAGLRISLGVGWMVLIAAELLSSSEGIGKFVWDQFQNGASDSFAKMMVVVFVVGIIGLFLDRIMVVFQRLVSFEGSVAAV